MHAASAPAFTFAATIKAWIISYMSQQDLLNRLETDLRTLLEQTRSQFSRLDADRLRYRPAPEAWNVLECFAHLNQFSEDYISRIELAIHKAKARRWAAGDDVRYSGRGRRAIRRANPDNGKAYKTGKAYNFNQLPLAQEVVKSFIINGERMLRVVQAAREIDINRAKVRKAHSWVGRYSVGELLEFLVLHARRHVLQAQRLIA